MDLTSNLTSYNLIGWITYTILFTFVGVTLPVTCLVGWCCPVNQPFADVMYMIPFIAGLGVLIAGATRLLDGVGWALVMLGGICVLGIWLYYSAIQMPIKEVEPFEEIYEDWNQPIEIIRKRRKKVKIMK